MTVCRKSILLERVGADFQNLEGASGSKIQNIQWPDCETNAYETITFKRKKTSQKGSRISIESNVFNTKQIDYIKCVL